MSMDEAQAKINRMLEALAHAEARCALPVYFTVGGNDD